MKKPRPRRIPIPATAAVGLGLTLAFTVVVGFLPGAVIDFARDAGGNDQPVAVQIESMPWSIATSDAVGSRSRRSRTATG